MAGKMPLWNLKGGEDSAQPLKGMLNGIFKGVAGPSWQREEPIPAYDDLAFLKDSRYIRDLVGESLLSELVEDLASLSGTSVTVCEKNGDCALKLISSNWCRFLDQASRRLCGTADGRNAMAPGKGPCFESCRNEAALVSIETRRPVDVPCRGGIRTFAVPVFAGGEVVGSLAIGYGDPPRDEEKLRDLAAFYGVPLEELRRQAEACESRPPLMIKLSRKRLVTTARVIGEIVAQKQVELALRRSEEKFHAVFHFAKDAIYLLDQEERLLDANKAALEILGYSREELMTMGPLDIDMSGAAEHDERVKALQRKGYVLFETLNRKRDGTLIPMEVSLQHLELAGSKVVLAVCRDISRRKQAEEALERRIVALTEPLENIGSVAFEDLFNLSDLQRLQDLLAATWGVSALITRPDGTPITKPSSFTRFCSTFIRGTEKGKRKCLISDAAIGRYDPSGPVIQTCLSAGLCGAGASITVGGRHIASWLIGQVRNERQDEEKILEYCRELGHDEKEFCEAYRQVPFMPQEKFEQIAHALFALANQLSTTAYQNIQQARFITERKRAEEVLRESERKLREAQRIARMGNWELDLITSTLQWSDGTYEIFEIDPGEFDASFEAFLKQIHPDDREMVHRLFAESMEDKAPYEISHRLLMKDGRIKWVHEIGRNEFDSEGRSLKCVGTVQDITELKQAEEALLESEARFRMVVESSPLPIGFANRDGRVEYVNPKFSEKFGYNIDDIPTLGEWFRCAFPDPVYRSRTVERLRRTVDRLESSTCGIEMDVTCSDGSVRNIELFRTLMGNKTLAVFNDLTERKQMEEERLRFDAQMREVQKLESLGVLAGGIAHDFNNLLMAILGYADLALLALSPASPVCQHVEEITRASHRAADLCRQMLAYSGKGRFVVSRCDLSEVVREMGKILDVSVSKKSAVRYVLADHLPEVESDVTQIRQVIMNLITNASDALGGAGGVITVTTGALECDEVYLSESYLPDHPPGGLYVYLEVSDTGCGMDSATQGKIFDPFFTTKFVGRGLGLAAVLGIVRGHRGVIKVSSEMGKGTTFRILLPAAVRDSGAEQGIAEQGEPLKGGGTVLVIDDDPFVVAVASAMLEKLGFEVLTAVNGREGLQVFRIHRGEITCVLLDLMMPEMGGEETLQELRNLQGDLPVILSSGFNEQDVTQRFVGKGLAGFIQKPYSVANLSRVLKSALG